jgi:hypothetical protein
MEWLSTISLALGSAWTSGINLYATVTILGLFQKLGLAKLPGGLEVIDNWWVIGIAAALYVIEFVADKVPYVDSVWDIVHTFIRVPAGAILAYSAVAGFNEPSIQVIAFLLGGGVALSSHGTVATARAVANLSPEPVSNWILSIIEDIVAFISVIVLAVAPIIIGITVVLFLIVFIWMLPKILRTLRYIFGAVRAFFNPKENFAEAVRKVR